MTSTSYLEKYYYGRTQYNYCIVAQCGKKDNEVRPKFLICTETACRRKIDETAVSRYNYKTNVWMLF